MSKILVGYISGSHTNGINTHLINFLNSFNHEHTIDILTTDDVLNVEKRINNNKKYNNIYKIPQGRHVFKQIRCLKKIMKENNYDIAYFNISECYNCFGLIAAKQMKINKIIVHSHSSDAAGGFKHIKRFLNYITKHIVSHCANLYLACSKKAAKWLFTNKIYKNNNYQIIYNKVDFKKYAFNDKYRKDIRKKYKMDNKFVIGYVGRFSKEKNYLFLADILSEILPTKKDAVLMCISGGEIEEFKKYAEKKGVLDNVIIVPPTADVYKYYSAFDVFLLPSRNEGLPLVGIEAQVNDCPTLFSDRITDEVLIGKNSKLVEYNNSAVWAKEILNIKDRSNELNDLSKKYNIEDKTQYEIITDIDNSKE